jgi:hypothetical protein
MADKNIIVRIDEEYGFQTWWVVYTPAQFAEVCYKWTTMKNLNCLVPVDLIFPGARGCFGEWPPRAVCPVDFETYERHTAHVHQADDSYFTGAKGFHIPDDDIEAFEIHNVIYNHAELCRLREISQQERTNDFYRLYPEYAKPAAGAESETCG